MSKIRKAQKSDIYVLLELIMWRTQDFLFATEESISYIVCYRQDELENCTRVEEIFKILKSSSFNVSI